MGNANTISSLATSNLDSIYQRNKGKSDEDLLEAMKTAFMSVVEEKSTPMYSVDDRVEGNYQSSDTWYKGNITGVGSGEQGEWIYDIEYDDDETENGLSADLIRRIAKKPPSARLMATAAAQKTVLVPVSAPVHAPAHAPVSAPVPAPETVIEDKAVSSTTLVMEITEVMCAKRKDEFLGACGKFTKGDSSANLARAQALLADVPPCVDVDTVDEDGWSALHHAAGEGHTAIVEFLLQYNANKNLQDPFGCTPLWVACFNDRRDSVKALLLAGADEKIIAKPENEPQQTAALAARRNRHPSLADLVDTESGLRANDPERISKQQRGEMSMEEFNMSLRKQLDPANTPTAEIEVDAGAETEK